MHKPALQKLCREWIQVWLDSFWQSRTLEQTSQRFSGLPGTQKLCIREILRNIVQLRKVCGILLNCVEMGEGIGHTLESSLSKDGDEGDAGAGCCGKSSVSGEMEPLCVSGSMSGRKFARMSVLGREENVVADLGHTAETPRHTHQLKSFPWSNGGNLTSNTIQVRARKFDHVFDFTDIVLQGTATEGHTSLETTCNWERGGTTRNPLRLEPGRCDKPSWDQKRRPSTSRQCCPMLSSASSLRLPFLNIPLLPQLTQCHTFFASERTVVRKKRDSPFPYAGLEGSTSPMTALWQDCM